MTAFLGVLRAALALVPRGVWEALAAVLALLAIWHWHNVKVREGIRAGVLAGEDVQAAADGRAVLRAFLAADAKQDALVARMASAQDIINKGATDAIATIDDAAGRALAGFELRHPAPQAAAGSAGDHAPAAASDATGRDARAAAVRAGMVVVPADAVADAARVAGRLVVCQSWATAQGEAWDRVVGAVQP